MVARIAPLDAWEEALDGLRAGALLRTVLTP
jgi:hypothetical protein